MYLGEKEEQKVDLYNCGIWKRRKITTHTGTGEQDYITNVIRIILKEFILVGNLISSDKQLFAHNPFRT